MLQFMDGYIMMAFLAAGVLFLRYWRRTRDRLFLMFSVAFVIQGFNRMLLAFWSHDGRITGEHSAMIYTVRLLAFLVILWAIIDKNRQGNRGANAAS